jgi:hypothetical protein
VEVGDGIAVIVDVRVNVGGTGVQEAVAEGVGVSGIGAIACGKRQPVSDNTSSVQKAINLGMG